MSEKPKQAADIFMTALEMETLAERSAYVKEFCGDDEQLLARVQALLEAHDRADSFLEKPPAQLAASLDAGLAPAFGDAEAVVLGSAGHSVLKSLGNTIDLSRVALREPDAEVADPIVRSQSPEMPQPDSNSRY